MATAQVKVLPPVILTAAFLFGIVLAMLFPDKPFPSGVAVWLGSAMVTASIGFVALAIHALTSAHTAFDVRKPTTSMVTSGVFRVTRNPVYLSMTLLYVGISLLVNSIPMSLVVVPLGSALCLLIIRPEERYLESQFGPSYRSYRAAVRRWI